MVKEIPADWRGFCYDDGRTSSLMCSIPRNASTRPQITAVVFVIAVGVGHGINGGIIINRTIIRTEHVIAYFTAFSGFTDFIGTILVGITKVKTEVATVGMINNRSGFVALLLIRTRNVRTLCDKVLRKVLQFYRSWPSNHNH